MKIKLCAVSIILLAAVSCSTSNNYMSNLQEVKSFQKAREEGNINEMCRAFSQLVKKEIIKKGMAREQVLRIIGPGDNFTGIYVPEGISAGYNKKIKVTSENYYKFFWVHFKQTADGEKYIFLKADSCD